MVPAPTRVGSLTIVGTGIRLAGQVTLETMAHLEHADKLFYLVADPAVEQWLRGTNATAESLYDCYAEGRERRRSYREMVARVLAAVRDDLAVVVAFYGHPGVFVDPAHMAIQIARREGFAARMLPGISAEDCLFAELEVDPADSGCQSYEASDFIYRRPRYDTSTALILWQIGFIDEDSIAWTANRKGLRKLVRRLERRYPPSHGVVVYESSCYPVSRSSVLRLPLHKLGDAELPIMATLYVPPRRANRRPR